MAGHKWQKGHSGNPGGRPRVPDELKKSCQRLAKRGLKVLEEIINSTTTYDAAGKRLRIGAKDSDRIAAVKLVLEYGYGKPVQPIGGEGEGDGPVVVQIVTLTEPEEGS